MGQYYRVYLKSRKTNKESVVNYPLSKANGLLASTPS